MFEVKKQKYNILSVICEILLLGAQFPRYH